MKKLLFRRTDFLSKVIESSTWVVVILILFGVRFLPKQIIDNEQAYYLIGIIVSFILLYYLVVYKVFSKSTRTYLKDIADIVLIGVLIHLMKDYGEFFFALYFLPIAAAALELQFINALLIATLASVFVVFEIFLGSYGLTPKSSDFYSGAWQIGLILFITIFCRFLAVQIKEEKTAKEEAIARQKALEEENKREKEFMSLTSHQLYTPLSIIRGFSSMLDDKKLGELNPKQEEAVNEIYTSVKRMINLVSELLSISRIQSGSMILKKKLTDAEMLVEDVAKEFNKTKEKESVEIEIDILNELNPIMMDGDKIRQVLYNLTDNAIKYTEKGKIKLSVKQDDKETIFAVDDDGIGIPKEDQEKIFQPFFRGKNILELDNKGTGLGLYIARLIIEKHGGKISAESEIGKGSIFSFSIPVTG